MKVELQCGDTITIPEGCKAIVKDGSVVFEKEFEDGDVLCSVYSTTIVIFKEEEKKGSKYFLSHYNSDLSSDKGWDSAAFRYATEEEKQLLFDKMKEQGLQWNAEEKRVEKIRWRSEECEDYHFLNADLSISIMSDTYSSLDDEFWDTFNYFRTEKQAKEAAKRVRETLRKYHEEIGE
jgi:hypothetical protein